LHDLAPDAFQILDDVVVPEAQNGDPLGSEPFRSAPIPSSCVVKAVLSTIELEGQSDFRTIEIEHLRTDWMLASEMQGLKLIAAQHVPKLPFGFGHLPSQPASLRGHAARPRETRV
jgi:hypothetical protein